MNSIAEIVEELEAGAVVQIDPSLAPDSFGGMFMVVTEVSERGIYGYVLDWGWQSTEPIYVRVPLDKFRETGGRVQWNPER